jgi:nucleoporin POM34
MTFENSPFAQSLYISGSPQRPTQPSSPKTTQMSVLAQPSNSPITSSPISSSNTATPRTPKVPNTPNAFKPSSPDKVPTGSWSHPAYSEIQKRTVNKEKIVKKVLINITVLVGLYISAQILSEFSFINSMMHSLPEVSRWMSRGVMALQFITAYNVVHGLWRLLQFQDKFEDLPLTPSQRKLFGLPESSKPSPKSTPSPPKYMKSSPQNRISPRPSPLARSVSSSSPLARLTSPARNGSGSDSSPSNSTSKTVASTALSNFGAQKLVNTTIGSQEASTSAPNSSSGNNSGRAVNKPTLVSNDSPDTPTPAQRAGVPSFTPSSRFKYMSETPRRRSLR